MNEPQTMYLLKFMLIMAVTALADISWTMYFIKVQKRKAFSSGMWSSVIVVLGAFATIGFVGDNTLVIAACLGAFIGTYLTVKLNKT